MTYALEIKNLKKSYKEFVLNSISMNVPEGSIMGFVGQNGAGKTTTIKSVLGLVNYDAGEINIFGKAATEGREGVGVVTDSQLYDPMWSISDVEWTASLFHKQWDKAQFATLLDKFAISRNKKVKDLSKGMNVKLMLAVAMSHHAKLLILDEPTSGLDPVARDELCEILKGYVKQGGSSILFSTHITQDLEKIASHVTCISHGNIVFSAKKEDILKEYAPKGLSTLDDIVVHESRRGV